MDFLFPNGFRFPDIPKEFALLGEPIFRIGPITYTNAHLTMLIVIAILTTVSFLATRDLKERPSGLQNFVELLVQGLADFVVEIGGPRALRYLPLFGTLFLFIVFSNWLSVVPFVGQVTWLHSPTADFHITFAMARMEAHLWEQGLIALAYANRHTLELPSQRYPFALFQGLPGGITGYDYKLNPCGFKAIHFGGLWEKPSDGVALQLAPQILGRYQTAVPQESMIMAGEQRKLPWNQ